MCLVAFALDAHPRHALVLAGNRDEVFSRPAAPLAAWDDAPHILAGRDLAAGGTWLGVTEAGRWGVLTNVRDPQNPRPAARSRGDLVSDFLRAEHSPRVYAEAVFAARDEFDGFNLVIGDGARAYAVSTREAFVRRLGPGVYGLSNDRLDTPWPKVVRARIGLREALRADPVHFDDLFALLDDTAQAADPELPKTGVGLDLERALSSVRIAPTAVPNGGAYGTRVSTALAMTPGGALRIAERTWRPDGSPDGMAEAERQLPQSG